MNETASAAQLLFKPAMLPEGKVYDIEPQEVDGAAEALLLCTPDDDFFEAVFAARQVSRAATEEEARGALQHTCFAHVIVDGSLPGWNPHRYLRAARMGMKVGALWLLVSKRDPQLLVLARAMGAHPLSRKPRSVVLATDPAAARRVHAEVAEATLGAIDRAFRAQAGPLAQRGIDRARNALLDGEVATLQAYAQLLLAELHLPASRSTFLEQARAALSHASRSHEAPGSKA